MHLKTRLKKARELHGPHIRLAEEIGISSDALQRFISGQKPKHRRVILLIGSFLARVGL